jgi:two-component system chemotaxis response regulator CheY
MNSQKPWTVLIVDDSPTMRGMIQRALAAAGYHVLEAADGIEGLSRLEEAPVQAILTDINMPRMDGLTFIRTVRESGRFPRLPILALTTEGEADMKAAGKAAGATGWIVKPFEPEQLCNVIGLVIKRMATQEQASKASAMPGA